MPVVKNHTALDNKTVSFDKTKFSGENIKQVFWKTSINDLRPKLKIQASGIEIEGLGDTGKDVNNNAPKSWHPNWALWEVKCSVSRGWNLISGKTKCNIGQKYIGPERKIKVICG